MLSVFMLTAVAPFKLRIHTVVVVGEFLQSKILSPSMSKLAFDLTLFDTISIELIELSRTRGLNYKTFTTLISQSVCHSQSHLPESNTCGQGQEPTLTAEFWKWLHSLRLQASLANIRHGWKLLTVTNTLAYYKTETITTVKSFYSTGP